MAARLSSNSRTLIAAAALTVIAAGAYMTARLNPPQGASTTGTIQPAERYRASQVGTSDVALGDNGVAMLMQTDAFQLMVKDPSFRQMARDANFAALAQNGTALAAMARYPQQFGALAHDQAAFVALSRQAD